VKTTAAAAAATDAVLLFIVLILPVPQAAEKPPGPEHYGRQETEVNGFRRLGGEAAGQPG
jgi:hypothetical protein